MIFARTSSSDNFYWKSQKLLISGRECYFITSADLQQFAIHLPIMKQYHITINSRSHYCNKSNRTHISFIIRFVWNVERFFFRSFCFFFFLFLLHIIGWDTIIWFTACYQYNFGSMESLSIYWQFAQKRYWTSNGWSLFTQLSSQNGRSNETPSDSAVVNRIFITDFLQRI